MNTKDIAAHYVFGVANKEIAKRDRTIASQSAEIERLRAELDRAVKACQLAGDAIFNDDQLDTAMHECFAVVTNARALAGQDGG